MERLRPEIICLCGSTRFVDVCNHWRQKLTLEGKIVLASEVTTSAQDAHSIQDTNPELKEMLDKLHLHKIDLSDTVMILNVGGYIGKSTVNEIKYAVRCGKKIVYLEPIHNKGG